MLTLTDWAAKWDVPPQAIRELTDLVAFTTPSDEDKSEAAVQSLVRLEAARYDARLWRNNVGAATTDTGSFIRFGLANDSKHVNEVVKSGDLIGIRKIAIMPWHVGSVIGQFVSRECKRSKGGRTEAAQVRWALLINANGGDAKIVNGPGSFK